MLHVSTTALNVIQEHLRTQKIDSAVRITMMGGCCVGENLRLTLCEREPNDLVFRLDGTVFLLDRELATRCGAIKVDFAPEYDHCPCSGRNGGFSISSERDSFRCCGHSFQKGGDKCWQSCPADCGGRVAAAYEQDEASITA
jgi:Fe-S cluster assembly iron-binding protein IscA